MEDVVLHYQPGSAVGLSSLLERAEKLLESFPRRTPPVFTPWFPTAADRHRPIRPAKPAPIITRLCEVSEIRPDPSTAQNRLPQPKTHENPRAESMTVPHETLQEPKDGVSETPRRNKGCVTVADRPLRRSWSVFTHRGVLLQSSKPLSKQFHHMVSVHRLHLYQRVKWVISQHNCGTSGDIEQVSISGTGTGVMLERGEREVQRPLLCLLSNSYVASSRQGVSPPHASIDLLHS